MHVSIVRPGPVHPITPRLHRGRMDNRSRLTLPVDVGDMKHVVVSVPGTPDTSGRVVPAEVDTA